MARKGMLRTVHHRITLPDENHRSLRIMTPDDKNEVHALDIDSSGPWPDNQWFDRAIKRVVAKERKRWLDPNDMCRLNYVIWNKQIADKDVDDFAWLPYHGTADDHTGHAHFSVRYDPRVENDTSRWGVLYGEDDMEFDDKLTLSKDTQTALGIQPAGGEIEFGSYLGTLGIRIGQGGKAAQQAVNSLAAVTGQLETLINNTNELLEKFTPVMDSGSTPEQKAAALKVILGDQAGTVGALLAGQ